jgi:hypothetical protein
MAEEATYLALVSPPSKKNYMNNINSSPGRVTASQPIAPIFDPAPVGLDCGEALVVPVVPAADDNGGCPVADTPPALLKLPGKASSNEAEVEVGLPRVVRVILSRDDVGSPKSNVVLRWNEIISEQSLESKPKVVP